MIICYNLPLPCRRPVGVAPACRHTTGPHSTSRKCMRSAAPVRTIATKAVVPFKLGPGPANPAVPHSAPAQACLPEHRHASPGLTGAPVGSINGLAGSHAGPAHPSAMLGGPRPAPAPAAPPAARSVASFAQRRQRTAGGARCRAGGKPDKGFHRPRVTVGLTSYLQLNCALPPLAHNRLPHINSCFALLCCRVSSLNCSCPSGIWTRPGRAAAPVCRRPVGPSHCRQTVCLRLTALRRPALAVGDAWQSSG